MSIQLPQNDTQAPNINPESQETKGIADNIAGLFNKLDRFLAEKEQSAKQTLESVLNDFSPGIDKLIIETVAKDKVEPLGGILTAYINNDADVALEAKLYFVNEQEKYMLKKINHIVPKEKVVQEDLDRLKQEGKKEFEIDAPEK